MILNSKELNAKECEEYSMLFVCTQLNAKESEECSILFVFYVVKGVICLIYFQIQLDLKAFTYRERKNLRKKKRRKKKKETERKKLR